MADFDPVADHKVDAGACYEPVHKQQLHYPGGGVPGFLVRRCDGAEITADDEANYRWKYVTCLDCLGERQISPGARLAEIIERHLSRFPSDEQARLHVQAADLIRELKAADLTARRPG